MFCGVGADHPLFNRRDAYVEVPNTATLQLGTGEFSVSAWVTHNQSLNDVPGDVVSMYDPDRRRGFHLTIARRDAATSGQSNAPQVEFGIDNARLDPAWTDRGRPGSAVYVMALAVYDGQLYAGTCEPGARQSGHVYRYDSGGHWIDCFSPDSANAVTALAVHRGHLYAATGCYRLRGSALPDSPNQTPGGHVYRYERPSHWVDCGKLGDAQAVNGLTTYLGYLHASSTYSPGVFDYKATEKWDAIGTPQGRRVESLVAYHGALFGGAFDGGEVYRYVPENRGWQTVGKLPATTQTYGFGVYRGRLYVGAWPTGSVYRYDGQSQWTNCGRLGEEKEVMPLVVYNGKLYGGTLPAAAVFRYDGDTTWTDVGRVDLTPDVTYRRAYSMAVFQGQLFCGTLPSGHVKSIRAGQAVSSDRELDPGWRHLTAVREKTRLVLYIDGKPVARSPEFAAEDYDLSIDKPLLIGFGSTDYFHGRIRDVRLYRRALMADEAARLAAEKPLEE
ncbi:MAG: LamG domain-containing protein [Planctomycetia bacterium]|nr:LamG domain-containing protein [Planctomycetia bacterium]